MNQTKVKYDTRVYLQWEKQYQKNPIGITNRLKNITTYQKTYFHILTLIKNKRLIEDIYNIIADKYNLDLYNYQHDKPISMLAKYMPRENSSFDKQLNFIEKFTKRIYPTLDKGIAFRLYRKNISMLCDKLNITERFISQKRLSEIDFNNVPVICLRRNMHTFLRDPICRDNLYHYLSTKFVNIHVECYIDYLANNKMHAVEREICLNAFSVRKQYLLTNDLHCISRIFDKYLVLVIDMSFDMFKTKKIYDNLLISLISLQYTNNIIINSNNPKMIDIHIRKDIDEKIKDIKAHMYDSTVIDLEKINKLLDKHHRKILILSNKPLINKNKCTRNIYIYPKPNTCTSSNYICKLFKYISCCVMLIVVFIFITLYLKN